MAAAPETQLHQSIHLAALSVCGHHRVIAMETEREHHSVAGVRRQWHRHRRATWPPQTKPTGLRPTSGCSDVIGRDGIVIDLERPWLVPDTLSLTHLPGGVCSQARWRGRMSSVKHATQNQCFITQPLNIYVVFSFCLGNRTEARAAGVATEKCNPWEDGNNPNVPAANQQLNGSDIGFMRFKDLTHTRTLTTLYFCLCEDFHQDNALTSLLP